MRNEGNHQFGLMGKLNASFKSERKVNQYGYAVLYVPNHPKAFDGGWYREHRLAVEQDATNFSDKSWFEYVDGQRVLLKSFDVHHKNANKLDDRSSNLEVLTRSQHTAEHNLQKLLIRNHKTGRIIGVVKLRELLENPEEGNQQPSLIGDDSEGSETRGRDSRESVMPPRVRSTRKRDDIVRTARITKTQRRRA